MTFPVLFSDMIAGEKKKYYDPDFKSFAEVFGILTIVAGIYMAL